MEMLIPWFRLKAEDLAHDAKLKAENMGHDVKLKAEEAKVKGNRIPISPTNPPAFSTYSRIPSRVFERSADICSQLEEEVRSVRLSCIRRNTILPARLVES